MSSDGRVIVAQGVLSSFLNWRTVYLSGIAAGLFAIGWAAWYAYIGPIEAAYLSVCAALAGAASFKFLQSVERGELMFMESHWGGLGGGLGGWRISRSATYFVVMAASTALLVSSLSGAQGASEASRQQRFETLFETYYPAIQVGRQSKMVLHAGIAGSRLSIAGSSPNPDATNAFWDAVKQCSSSWSSELTVQLGTIASNGPGKQPANAGAPKE